MRLYEIQDKSGNMVSTGLEAYMVKEVYLSKIGRFTGAKKFKTICIQR